MIPCPPLTSGKPVIQRYEVGLFANENGQASAQGHFVHVYVDRLTQRPVPLPQRLRQALETLEVAP